MPPTYGYFYQHVLRAHIQVNIWWNADIVLQPKLTIERYGWCTDEDGDMQHITYDGGIALSHVVDLVQSRG